MRRAYIFSFADAMGTASEVKSIMPQLAGVLHWRYELAHTIFMISEESADFLAKQILAHYPNKRFIVAEVHTADGACQGWLDEASWYFLLNKKPAPPAQ